MADVLSIISADYKARGAAIPSRTRYVAVDPALYQGKWTGAYANKKTFTLTVYNVSGFRAQVKYESGDTVKSSSVLIKDNSFRIGDTKFTWAKPGAALVKTVVTDPATGSTYLDTAAATKS